MRWVRRLAARRDERGNALVEFTWLALILLVPLAWIVITVFDVQRGAFAVTAAARAAGRAYALAPDDSSGRERAEQAAALVLSDQGVPGQRGSVVVTCETPVPGNCHVGTSVITVEVTSAVDLPWVPEFLDQSLARVALDASHTVPIGQYVEAASGGEP